jgi:exonuclease SbcD
MHRVDSKPCPVYYGGSPLSYSFAEANQEKYVLMIEAEPGETAKVSEIELKQGKRLLRKRAKGLEEALNWLAENQDALVELTLVTETFLTALERRRLNAVHPGIVAIVPEVADAESLLGSRQKQIDLNQSMEKLFCDYFKHEKGQDPNEDLMNLFKEILAEEE